MDYNLTGSSVHGIFQARILEWVAISFSRGSSRPKDRTRVSHIVDRRFTVVLIISFSMIFCVLCVCRRALYKTQMLYLVPGFFLLCMKGGWNCFGNMPGTTANYLLKEGNTFLLHGYKIPFIHVSPHNCFFWKGFYLTANLLVFLFL